MIKIFENLTFPDLDILEEGRVAVIEDITLPAIETPRWVVILSIVPPKINQTLFSVTLTFPKTDLSIEP